MKSRVWWQVVSTMVAVGTVVGVGCKAHARSKPPTPPPAPVSAEPAAVSAGSVAFPVEAGDWKRLGYRLDWIGVPFPAAKRGARLVHARAWDDVVAAQIDDSTVSITDASNGERRWSTDLTGPLTKWVGMTRDPADANRLMVASESECFVLAVATSNLLVRESFARVVNTSPIWEGHQAYFGCSTGEVLCHVVGRGVKRWGFMANGSVDSQPVRVGDAMALASAGGDVTFLTLDGSLRGRNRVLAPVVADLATDGNAVFVASTDQSLWAFENGGQLRWRHRTPARLTSTPTVHENVVYCDVPGAGLLAVDATSGETKWQSKASGRVIGVRKGRLLVHDASARVLATVDPTNGDVFEHAQIAGIGSLVLDAFVDGRVYAVSDQLRMAKFAPAD